MKNSTIEALSPLADLLRGFERLEERRPFAFFLDGRDFLHFHETPVGLVADVLLTRGRVRMPVSTEAFQAELMDEIEATLSSLDSRASRRSRRKGWRSERTG